MEYLRRSGSRVINTGRESEHTRQGSQQGNNGVASEDALYRGDTACDVYRSTSGDGSSDGILGLRSTKESLSGGMLTDPRAAYVSIASPNHTQADIQLSWLQPSIMTTISAGDSGRASQALP
jgi:hypothetical protein